jgi:hypothetical protein
VQQQKPLSLLAFFFELRKSPPHLLRDGGHLLLAF